MKRYLNKNNSMCVIRSMENNIVKKAAKNLVVSDFCINTHTHTILPTAITQYQCVVPMIACLL